MSEYHSTDKLLFVTAGEGFTESVLPLGVGAGVFAGEGAGVLEIKCPFNRGEPNMATPPKLPQWYYMPQVSCCQTLNQLV